MCIWKLNKLKVVRQVINDNDIFFSMEVKGSAPTFARGLFGTSCERSGYFCCWD